MILHFISLVLTFADVFGIVAAAGYLGYLYLFRSITQKDLILCVGIIVVCIVLFPIIDVFRQKSRTRMKYDKYGRMKQFSRYEKMSVKEQKAFDKERMKEMERLLPSTMIREITHTGTKTPEADLQALTGLEEVKQKVEEMQARMQHESRHRKKGNTMAKHMVFFGPPGTGKTTVASIMTAFLHRYGYIPANRFIQINGSFFSGDTASRKMEAVTQRAFGGVLFIDEAYALMQGPFANEAVATLLTQMEDHRDKFVLILAGYEDEMKDLLRSNPGFMSRISEFLYFRNYTPNELLSIFKGMAKKEGYSVDESGEAAFLNCISRAMNETSFGNARTCRAILDRSISRYYLNAKKAKRKKNVLTGEDIVYEKNPLAS